MSDAPRAPADAEVRRRAQTDFTTPLLVEAGAGSGKTSILVARVVAWALGPGWERNEAALLERNGRAPADDVARATLSRIVAITFTDAAAAEMAARVGEWLGRISVGDDPAEIAAGALPDAKLRRERAAPLRAALDRLVVRTIHAWCRRLLASRPLEAGLHPGFQIDADEERTTQIVREVVEQAIPDAYVEPTTPLARLAAAGFGPARVEEALAALVLGGAEPGLLAADPLAPERIARLTGRLAAGCRGFVDAGGERLAPYGSRMETTVDSIVATARRVGGAPPADAAALAELLQALDEIWEKNSLVALRKWTKGEFGKKGGRALGGDEARVARACADLARTLEHALKLEPERLDLARRALEPLFAEVQRRLRRGGVETFAALLRDASRLVAGRPAAVARIREGIDQLLVDEFQDTDALQCEIVARIGLPEPDAEAGEGPTEPGEGPTLFLVGDPRQSIYGWRTADLRAYDAFARRIAAAGGAKLHLTTNFRSLPAVLGAVRNGLAPHMIAEPGVMPDFQDLDAHRETPAGEVERWVSWRFDAEEGSPAKKTRARDAALLEARAVAADVARLHHEAGVAWSDVALLFRGLTDVDLYLDALRDADVPYAVERDRRYYQRREVIEASALLRAVLDPHDHVALVAWLRSASVGVPDAAWVPLWSRGFPEAMSALRRPDAEALAPLRDTIDAAAGAVDPDVPGLDRIAGWPHGLAAAVETLAELRASAERDPSDAFVERLRVATGIELTEAARYLGPYRAANLDQFFRDVRNHLEETGGDVSEVLRRVRRAVDEQAEVEEARPRDAADEAVRVMSIHKAKGLDFDHVYLLQLHKGQGGGRPVTAVGRGEDGEEYQILGTASLGYDTAERQRVRTEDAERVRTLYVAMTRARDRLVLVGKHPRKGDGLANSHARLLGPEEPEKDRTVEQRMTRLAAEGGAAERDADGVLWRFPDLEPERAPRRRADAADAPPWPSPAELGERAARLARRREAARAHAARPRARAASALSHEAHRERVHARRFPEQEAAPAPEAPPRDAARAAAVGTALHAALERWDAGEDVEAARAAALARVDAALPALVGASELDAARAEAARILDRFVASPLLDRLREIDAHVVARELPVLLRPRREDDAVGHVVGAVDLLYRDPETGAWVVADYKSDDVSGEAEMRERADRYAAQGAAYVRAVREALGLDEPPRFELWFLSRGERVSVEVPG